MRLVDNVYAYVWQGNDNNCNSYLIASSLKGKRHILVDPGHITTPFYGEPGLAQLVREMGTDGIDAREIGLIILTHSHTDHCEAAGLVKEGSGALVALNKADEWFYQMLGGKVDMYLEEGDLVLGEENQLKLKVFHSPGHSPGHVTIYWPEHRVLIAGDVIFYQSTGRVDLPGGSAEALKQSIRRLSELDVEYLLCGHAYGHPGIIQGKDAVKRNFDFVKRNVFPYL